MLGKRISKGSVNVKRFSLAIFLYTGLVVMGRDSWVRIPVPGTGWTFFQINLL